MLTAVYTLVLLVAAPCSCFNHWVVTEEGKIEYQVASPFNLRQPFDLMALIQQEERVSLLKDLKEELIEYKNEFESYSGFETFDESFRARDYDCKNVKLISSYDLYITTVLPLEHKGVRLKDHLDLSSNPQPFEPYCNITPLDFSMYALEHLEGVQARRSLVASPEKSVLWSIDVRIEVFGSLVHHALKQNSTSWILLDLATLYWRARGNPYHAIECIRRALHHSPEGTVDIALLNLANVLHRSHHSEDALVPLRVAVTIAPSVNVLHYTLGNIYAALNQLNESVRSFKRSYDLQPDGKTAGAMYKAALCELKMEQASQERSDKLDLTQKKLDQFYEYMDIVRQQQVVSVSDDGAILSRPKKKPKKQSDQPSQIKAMDATPVLDPDASRPSTPHTPPTLTRHEKRETKDKIGVNERKSESNARDRDSLERALDDAVLNMSSHLTPENQGSFNDSKSLNVSDETVAASTSNHSNGTDDVIDKREKPRRSKLRLVLKPLSPEEEEREKDFIKCPKCTLNQKTSENLTIEQSNSCPNKPSPFIFNLLIPLDKKNTCTVNSTHSRPKNNSNSPLVKERQQSSLPEASKESCNKTENGSEDAEMKKTYSELNEALNCALGEGSNEKCIKKHQEYHSKLQKRQELEKNLKKETTSADVERNRNVHRKVRADAKGPPFDEMTVFQHFDSEEWQGPRITVDAQGRKMGDATLPENFKPLINTDYPESYHKMNFLPYNPLPEQLESIIFPKTVSPLATFDDPYWPGKQDCLQLVQKLRFNPKFASFTGTFIIPEARGADIDKLFESVPWVLPSNMQNEPRCTDIVDLPFSMSSMDHLAPILHRSNLRVNQELGERVIQKVLIQAVKGESSIDLSFEESGHRTYAAMLKNGPNWALFNLASVYWRVIGDPTNAIECLRRGIHYAPSDAKDVGYIGLANVLHRQGYLNESVIVARAALDVSGNSPVAHYTLASIYLSLNDYVASSLHLRAALRAQPKFQQALNSLQFVRCSMKFSEEHKLLKKKKEDVEREMFKKQEEELMRSLQEAMSSGNLEKQTQPAMILESKEVPELPEMKIKELISSPFTGEDAIRYLIKLSLYQQRQKQPQNSTSSSEKTKADKIHENSTGTGSDPAKEEQTSGHQLESNNITKIPIKSTSKDDGTTQDDQAIGIKSPTTHSKQDKASTMGSKDSKEKAKDSTHVEKPAKGKGSSEVDDLDPELMKILNEAAEAIKKNQTPVTRQFPTKVRKTPQQIKEEEIKRRFPGKQPWPTLEECQEKPLPKTLVFTSTWLSVTAKGVNIKDHIDYKSSLDHYPKLPYCHNDFPLSRKTLNHLTGMNGHPLMQYKAEKGLQEVLCTLDGYKRNVDEMATRIKLAMDKNSTSWVLSNMAALYWRIVGQGQLAIKCLKHALYYSNDDVRDVALVSLANVLYRIGYDMDAMAVIHMSLEVGFSASIVVEASPTLVVTHFTMANMLAAQGFFSEAAGFYESTLLYQPEFQPAIDRLKTARCLILVAKHRKDKGRDKVA